MAPFVKAGTWDYEDAQWAGICSAIKRVRTDPLSDAERDALRVAVDGYIAGPRYRTERNAQARERRAWGKASRLILELKQAMELAAGIKDAILGPRNHKSGAFEIRTRA